MKKSSSVVLFNDKQIRRIWDDEAELWYFSIIDIIGILTASPRPRKYWHALKTRLKREGSELSLKVGQLKMKSPDGKQYMTDVMNTEMILRLIQSIPSPRAEPFKLWLAKVGYARIEETEDPEAAFNRAIKTYLQKGYSEEWVSQRLKSIIVRKELTDEWRARGVKEGLEYAILTDEIMKAWSDKSVKVYKRFKRLKKESLRDNMTNLELVLNMLAEVSTTTISKKQRPKNFVENKSMARKGGLVARQARLAIEKQTGESVIDASKLSDGLQSKDDELAARQAWIDSLPTRKATAQEKRASRKSMRDVELGNYTLIKAGDEKALNKMLGIDE